MNGDVAATKLRGKKVPGGRYGPGCGGCMREDHTPGKVEHRGWRGTAGLWTLMGADVGSLLGAGPPDKSLPTPNSCGVVR